MKSDVQPEQTLGVASVAFLVLVAVVSLRWIPSAARAGWLSLWLWFLAAVLFFAPLALVVRELSARFPEQGGLFVWVQRGFGPRHSFFCGWCLWLNQVFYFPSYLLYAWPNLLLLAGPRAKGLALNRPVTMLFVLGFLWLLTLLNIRGFEAAKWIQGLGALAVWIPVVLLFVAAFVRTPDRTVHEAAASTGFTMFSALGLWSSMCFAFSGFEIAGLVGQEIREPKKTVPRGLLLAGISVLLLYLGGSAAILWITPPNQIDARTGIGDAIQASFHSTYAGGLISLLLAAAAIAATSSWMAGAARIPYAAALEGWLPETLGRLHGKYRTPHIALITQSVFASVALLASMLLNVDGKTTSVEDAYEVMTNLTILIYFVPYLYLFVSPLFLLKRTLKWKLLAGAGVLTTFVAIILLFVPPPGDKNVLTFETSLILQSAAVFAAGLFFERFYGRRSRGDNGRSLGSSNTFQRPG